jgi:uncharacterized protein
MDSSKYLKQKYVDDNLKKLINLAENKLSQDSSGHGLLHSLRVIKIANAIKIVEGVNNDSIFIAAIFHDYYRKEEQSRMFLHYSSKAMKEFKLEFGDLIITMYGEDCLDEVIYLIENHEDYSADKCKPISLQILQDADRIDAIGATGIARAFMFSGAHHGVIYKINDFVDKTTKDFDASIDPHGSSTLEHYRSKLSKLYKGMNTKTGANIAKDRQTIMDQFFSQLENEFIID